MRLSNNTLYRRLECQPIPVDSAFYYLDGAAYSTPPHGKRIKTLKVERIGNQYMLSYSNKKNGSTLAVSANDISADGMTTAEVLQFATDAERYLPRPSSECRGL